MKTPLPPKPRIPRLAWAGWSALLPVLFCGCANYRFIRALDPLLTRTIACDRQYGDFEDFQSGKKHWQENMSILKGMANEKNDILQKVTALQPNRENEELVQALIMDLRQSIDYLNLEISYFHKNTEYGMWLANAVIEGAGTVKPKPELIKAKEEVLRLQEGMTALADKLNDSQAQLAKILREKNIRRDFQPLKYAKYHKDHVGYKVK